MRQSLVNEAADLLRGQGIELGAVGRALSDVLGRLRASANHFDALIPGDRFQWIRGGEKRLCVSQAMVYTLVLAGDGQLINCVI